MSSDRSENLFNISQPSQRASDRDSGEELFIDEILLGSEESNAALIVEEDISNGERKSKEDNDGNAAGVIENGEKEAQCELPPMMGFASSRESGSDLISPDVSMTSGSDDLVEVGMKASALPKTGLGMHVSEDELLFWFYYSFAVLSVCACYSSFNAQAAVRRVTGRSR
jgi:hypothetical protein